MVGSRELEVYGAVGKAMAERGFRAKVPILTHPLKAARLRGLVDALNRLPSFRQDFPTDQDVINEAVRLLAAKREGWVI